ncbi:nickel pincer cofactor biosynthesis protein LarC [Treponema sp. TIM-1]|uniref:nickel pincer cofactor biosynthesis protein LarC n=1 Tax=Treponema sp. TIM-1 TaxID=2898417 RepID=UPI00398099A5
MKTLHFDCFAGISGDMALGALVDLGLDTDILRAELRKLPIKGWNLEFHREQRGGIVGIQGIVDLGEQRDHIAHDHGHEHHHGSPEHHHVGHDGGSGTHQGGHHSWKEIRALIENSPLTPGAKTRALDIFTRIARAEAEVHGVPEEDITFHEVGALDSIIDIVGCAICLDMIKPDRITCGEVELGSGTVTCAHGVLPVPAPATLILCRGMPVKTGGFPKEMTTPTGAAILAATVDEFTTAGSFREIKTGYGIGTRRMERPNLLRVSLREEADVPPHGDWRIEELVLLEANIDDMSGEALGFLMETLFAAGALDVTFTPVVMKKSRPGTIISVLCPPKKLDTLRELMFKKSATIGFRETEVRRLSLRREEDTLEGEWGAFRRKTVFYGEKPLRSKLEYDDRARIAREQGLSLEEAEERILTGLPKRKEEAAHGG